MGEKKVLFVVDDDPALVESLSEILSEDFEVHGFTSPRSILEIAQTMKPSLFLIDEKMPQLSGTELLLRLRRIHPFTPSIIFTAYPNIENAVRAMKAGAVDFLTKPIHPRKLLERLRKALWPGGHCAEAKHFPSIIGKSPPMREVWELVSTFAPSDVTILLEGETGTGKEVFARTIHNLSPRKSGPFVIIDCGALPESLIESEIFGYEKGAFTGASSRKPGKFELASGGTLFLDEVGNLPLSAQPKLLRILEEGSVYPVGNRTPQGMPIDVRIVAASNISLIKAVEKGEFRPDLYYRLSSVSIRLPGLSERTGDIPLLARYFFNLYSERYGKKGEGISEEAMRALERYEWPGNVRELENVIKSALLWAKGKIELEHLPERISRLSSGPGRAVPANAEGEGVPLKELVRNAKEEAERRILKQLLDEKKFTKVELARYLHIDPKTLRSKLRSLGIEENHKSAV